MALNPRFWFPVAVGASVVNLVAVGFTMGAHAAIHGVLGLGFGLWGQRLRERPAAQEQQQLEAGTTEQLQAGIEALETEITRLRQELAETQERVDFVERVLAKTQDKGRLQRGDGGY